MNFKKILIILLLNFCSYLNSFVLRNDTSNTLAPFKFICKLTLPNDLTTIRKYKLCNFKSGYSIDLSGDIQQVKSLAFFINRSTIRITKKEILSHLRAHDFNLSKLIVTFTEDTSDPGKFYLNFSLNQN